MSTRNFFVTSLLKKGNETVLFFLSVNTVILFLGTAIAPILMIYVKQIPNSFLEFLTIAMIGVLAVIVSIFMPNDHHVN